MSDSRLEKFIYAICSMDVSDLPVPLSRIEKLWNCLITGETPDFEPLSRNEKYLMAMLDRYDISNLPAPMSRGEKLLYKIAVGETDLSDVPGYLSRYEELLKYLIEDGGISEDDFEYVLYTLNQSLYTLYTTAEKPVKSAILKGQTLVNLVTQKSESFNGTRFLRIPLGRTLKANTKYFVKFNLRESSLTNGVVCRLRIGTSGSVVGNLISDGIITVTDDGYNYIEFYIRNADDVANGLDAVVDDIMLIEYQDGMENWDIPYFEGMQSVKMPVLKTTGKNLFDGKIERGSYSATTKQKIDSDNTRCRSSVVPVIPDGIKCRATINEGFQFYLRLFKDGKVVKETGFCTFYNLDNTSNTFSEITIVIKKSNNTAFTDDDVTTVTIQIEEGSVGTEYEPFKSNILTVNEGVTLRGIGDVKDTLDCLTGQVTNRISETVMNGNENWVFHYQNNTNTIAFRTPITGNLANSTVICDKFVNALDESDTEHCFIGVSNFVLFINRGRLSTVDPTGLKQYLTQNPFTIQYQLKSESVKTVDLTVVDQDNRPTQLGTFENVTHVSLEAENLIPEVEMEVATHISTELASASPLMDDISTKQEQLETTVDEQSNNVVATMIATTEIFEETL